MADVFLSYARADSVVTRRIARELGKAGRSIWFDRELPAHRAYSDVIASELDNSGAVLVLWSKAAVGSQWVRSEANRARELGKLVQARLDGERLPMPFDQIQCANLHGWHGAASHSGWTQVRRSIDALLGRQASSNTPASKSTISRRGFVISGAAAAASLAGIGGWTFLSRQRSISPEAQLYLQKGIDELQTNDAFELNNPASLDQAITLLTDATHAAPDSAEAWGALAMAYAARKKASPLAERPGLDARSRSAAKEALSLDRRESRALGAVRMLDPVYRHWSDAERADREALKLQPRMPLLLFLLGDVYASVGRWNDAAALSRKFDRSRFLIAGADRKVVVNLWSAGDLQGADEAMRVAVDHWPHNPYVWRTQIGYLLYSGRPAEALSVINDRALRPPDTPDKLVAAFAATARALAGEASRSHAVATGLALLESSPDLVFAVVHACAALGDAANLFSILQGYFFGEGPWARVAPSAGDDDRLTSPLFQPPMRPVWGNSGFDLLLRRIGLQDYWRQSHTVPDFRA